MVVRRTSKKRRDSSEDEYVEKLIEMSRFCGIYDSVNLNSAEAGMFLSRVYVFQAFPVFLRLRRTDGTSLMTPVNETDKI